MLPLAHQFHESQQGSPTSAAPPTNDVPRRAHDELVGKDVILYAMLRSDLPVAKGTVISTNPSTMVGGQALGKQFCEVVVNLVLKRDAILPRPYVEMETMADALMMSIAWPYKRLMVGKASKSSPCNAVSGEELGRALDGDSWPIKSHGSLLLLLLLVVGCVSVSRCVCYGLPRDEIFCTQPINGCELG